MKKQEQVNKLVEQAMQSMEAAEKATPPPYLLTRINARLAQPNDNVWERALGFIGRPTVAISGLCLLITINVLVLVNNEPDGLTAITEQVQNSPDEFSNPIATIYENENP